MLLRYKKLPAHESLCGEVAADEDEGDGEEEEDTGRASLWVAVWRGARGGAAGRSDRTRFCENFVSGCVERPVHMYRVALT